MRIAILEDDLSQLELLGHWLALAGHEPQRFEHGEDLLQTLANEDFDLLILDWNLPDITGIDVLRRIRASGKVPVIFCTSRESQDDVVRALHEGANDYLHKPVRRMELLARIESVTRRAQIMHEQPESFEVEGFQVNSVDHTISKEGKTFDLSEKDYALAALFLNNVGRLLSRKYIHDAV